MKVLVGCEFSGVVRRAFRDRGHDAFSCDLLPCEDGQDEYHLQCDVRDVIYQGDWNLAIFHPSCQFLCNSGVRWLFNKDGTKDIKRWDNLFKAREFFLTLFNSPIPKICIENPIPHKYAELPPYTQTVQPYDFYPETTSKRTCLWLKNLPKLSPNQKLDKKRITRDIWLEPPSINRWKNRSRTFLGLANRMAETWG